MHTDSAGPMTPVARDGFRYAVLFTDDYSGVIFIYFLQKKSDAIRATNRFLADVAPYGNVKQLRSDNVLYWEYFKRVPISSYSTLYEARTICALFTASERYCWKRLAYIVWNGSLSISGCQTPWRNVDMCCYGGVIYKKSVLQRSHSTNSISTTHWSKSWFEQHACFRFSVLCAWTKQYEVWRPL